MIDVSWLVVGDLKQKQGDQHSIAWFDSTDCSALLVNHVTCAMCLRAIDVWRGFTRSAMEEQNK